MYTEQLATTRCTTTVPRRAACHEVYEIKQKSGPVVPRRAACHEVYEIKQKSGPAFQSQSLALLQHRSFLNLAARQKKGLGLI